MDGFLSFLTMGLQQEQDRTWKSRPWAGKGSSVDQKGEGIAVWPVACRRLACGILVRPMVCARCWCCEERVPTFEV